MHSCKEHFKAKLNALPSIALQIENHSLELLSGRGGPRTKHFRQHSEVRNRGNNASTPTIDTLGQPAWLITLVQVGDLFQMQTKATIDSFSLYGFYQIKLEGCFFTFWLFLPSDYNTGVCFIKHFAISLFWPPFAMCSTSTSGFYQDVLDLYIYFGLPYLLVFLLSLFISPLSYNLLCIACTRIPLSTIFYGVC